MLEMEQIAGTVILEEELINIIIDGIGDPINTSAIRFVAESLEHLKVLLRKYESIRPTRGITPTPAFLCSKPVPVPLRQDGKNDKDEPPRCYNCSQYGHYHT